MPDFLRCENLSKRFGAVNALVEVNLTIATPGGFTCILGPSGCGKSTLLRAIAGLEELDTGRICIADEDITAWPPARRGFGIVFQSYALFPNLTVWANVAYGIRGTTRAALRQRALEMLQLVRLPDIADRYPAELSGGQQQRVALARALAIAPRLLLLDEPLSALDARIRADLREELRALQRRLGITTIIVTHDQEEALALADEVVVMNEGHIVQCASPQEVYRLPHSAFVADFIGAMNFLSGWLIDDGWAYCGRQLLRVYAAAQLHSREMVLGIRPEEIEIATEGTPQNRMHAQIIACEFRGAFYRVRLLVPGDDAQEPISLIAHFPTALVEKQCLRSGDAVPIRLPAERLRLFLAEPEHRAAVSADTAPQPHVPAIA